MGSHVGRAHSAIGGGGKRQVIQGSAECCPWSLGGGVWRRMEERTSGSKAHESHFLMEMEESFCIHVK